VQDSGREKAFSWGKDFPSVEASNIDHYDTCRPLRTKVLSMNLGGERLPRVNERDGKRGNYHN